MTKESEYLPKTEDTIENLRKIAGLIVIGRRACKQALKGYPFIPDFEQLADTMWNQSGVEYFDVPQEQRQLVAKRGGQIILLMADRAGLQQKYDDHPDVVKRNIAQMLRSQLDPKVDIEFDSMQIVWGLFSFGLMFPQKEFDKLQRLHFGHSDKKSTGYVTGELVGPLGAIPVICKGSSASETIDHEDLHVLQQHFGFLAARHDLGGMATGTEVSRSILQENIQSGDLDASKKFMGAVAIETYRDIIVEFQTNAWEGKFAHSNLMDTPSFGHLRAAFNAVLNCAFHPISGLTEKQKFEEVFEAQKVFNDLVFDRLTLAAIIEQSKRTYKGPLSKNEWAAALTLMFSPKTPIDVIRAVMLGGRNKQLDRKPERLVYVDLAGAVVAYARRTVNPESYAAGEIIPFEKFELFTDVVANTFKSSKLTSDILTRIDVTREEIVKARRKIIEYVKKSAPEGKRSAIEKMIVSKLQT